MTREEDCRIRIDHEFTAKDIVWENGNKYEVETTYSLKDGTWRSRITPLIPQEEAGGDDE